MIRVSCHTNLDEYRHEEWPEWMVALPRIDDWVEATSSQRVLRVVKIKHCMLMNHNTDRYEPCALVELHKC